MSAVSHWQHRLGGTAEILRRVVEAVVAWVRAVLGRGTEGGASRATVDDILWDDGEPDEHTPR